METWYDKLLQRFEGLMLNGLVVALVAFLALVAIGSVVWLLHAAGAI